MYIIIDNSDREKIIFFFLIKDIWKEKVYKTEGRKPLLIYIDKLLVSQKKIKNDIKGIGIIIGKGSFTSARVSVTTANIFGLALDIPLITLEEFNPILALDKFRKAKRKIYLSAKYSAKPNITKPKVKKQNL